MAIYDVEAWGFNILGNDRSNHKCESDLALKSLIVHTVGHISVALCGFL